MIVHNPLFSNGHLSEFLSEQENRLLNEIEDFKEDYLLNTNFDELLKYLKDKYSLEPLKLDEEKIETDRGETMVDIRNSSFRGFYDSDRTSHVKGTLIKFFIPFSGDEKLFELRTSTFTTYLPSGKINQNELLVEIQSLDNNDTSIKKEFEDNVREIKKWLAWSEKEVTNFNNSLEQKIKIKMNSRREKLMKASEAVSNLGYPLRRRADAPNTYSVPEIKRKIIPIRPSAKVSGGKIEPTLEVTEYDYILKIISNMAQVMERSPNTFKEMKEEDLRNHFLVQLNAQYEGQATGETFNANGKTDILIRIEGKNIFIAECKFWTGKEGLVETINQLLGYISWRDTKTAIILFNKNKNTSHVLSQIPETVKEHQNYVKSEKDEKENSFKFIMKNKNDDEKTFTLTIKLFDIPQ
jgi:hypothetical protein